VTEPDVAGAKERVAVGNSSKVKRRRARWVWLLAGGMLLLAAGPAMADLIGLPLNGAQVNNDPAAGIDPSRSAKESDVVGGSLQTGAARVPWAVFRQQTTGADQIFSRSFANGAWTTRGNGTVFGKSSASPTFSGSLNFDQGQDGEAPAIDFAGTGRTVPWATWYENTTGTGFGQNNIFASRFDNSGGVNQNKWIFSGQSRGDGGTGTKIPSLNIHTDQSAENPSVSGGSAVDPTKPGPWVTWQETTNLPVAGKDQIFVSRPLGPGQANCDGVTPAGVADGTGHVPAIGGFCFQQTGFPCVGPGGNDPSLNVDPTRNGVEPDIAFTGTNDSVPWVVWYEKDPTNNGISGLTHNNEMVFAAKGVSNGSAQGGFQWVAVGSQGSAVLDATGTNHFGGCAVSDTAEENCSLNKGVNADAEDPRVAAGTLKAGNPTVPWAVWSEDTGRGVHGIFVSRLVGAGAQAHFELFNGGAPVSDPHHDASVPDITFFGNIPYVSWLEQRGGNLRGFVGHFDPNLGFVLDTPRGVKQIGPPRARARLLADVRQPISSACTADPFTNDGSNCTIAPVNAPFFLFTTSDSPQRLFAQAIVGGISCALFPGCEVKITQSGSSAVISSVLARDDSVGILVQRVVRFTRVHGKRIPVLKLVGRVPLGKHRHGRVHIRWNLKVNGHRLSRGTYLIVLRGFDRHRILLGTTKPLFVKVR
jgi:hypothetical protein